MPSSTASNTTQPNIDAKPTGRGWFIALGALLILVGAGALLFPILAALSLNLVAGAALLTAGLFTLVHAFGMKKWRGFGLGLLLGVLYTITGLLFVLNPLTGILTLTVLLGALFTADGVARVLMAFKLRPERSWWVFLLTGSLSLVLGVLVLLGLPSGWSLGFLGILLGINMIFAGISYIACSGDDANCAPTGPARGDENGKVRQEDAPGAEDASRSS